MAGSECLFCVRVAAPESRSDDDLVWRFPNSVVLLGPWQYYHGYCVLVARRHATELSQLDDAERRAFLDEMCGLARGIEAAFRPLKLNYELLGNQVPHLHWHLFPRYAHDAGKLHPVWTPLERAKADGAEDRRLRHGPMTRPETIGLLRQQLRALGLPGSAP